MSACQQQCKRSFWKLTFFYSNTLNSGYFWENATYVLFSDSYYPRVCRYFWSIGIGDAVERVGEFRDFHDSIRNSRISAYTVAAIFVIEPVKKYAVLYFKYKVFGLPWWMVACLWTQIEFLKESYVWK